jgi:hypothetical protein
MTENTEWPAEATSSRPPDDHGDELLCGRCRRRIRSLGQGQGYEHVVDGSTDGLIQVEDDHTAWWATTRDLRNSPAVG